MELVDSHAHLDFPQFNPDREEVIRRAEEAGIRLIVNVGADLDSSRASVALAERYPFVYAAVGVHPHDADTLDERALKALTELARHPKVVAIGEIGLDFYRDLSPRQTQRKAFLRQLELASRLGKPVIIHDRDAHREVLSIIRDYAARADGSRPLGVLHCFSGDIEMALKAIELGFFISVAGPVTFKNARKLPQIVRELPLDSLLVETDCPYLTPHPYRGKRNEPAYVRLVAEAVARIKGIPAEQVARVTLRNAIRLFGIAPGSVNLEEPESIVNPG